MVPARRLLKTKPFGDQGLPGKIQVVWTEAYFVALAEDVVLCLASSSLRLYAEAHSAQHLITLLSGQSCPYRSVTREGALDGHLVDDAVALGALHSWHYLSHPRRRKEVTPALVDGGEADTLQPVTEAAGAVLGAAVKQQAPAVRAMRGELKLHKSSPSCS